MDERSHFIPLRRQELTAKIQEERNSDEFARLGQLIHHTIRFESDERAEALRAAYAPFDPDPVAEAPAPATGTATVPAREDAESGDAPESSGDSNDEPESGPPAGGADENVFLSQADTILRAANFRRVTDTELEAAFNARSLFPLLPHVDTSGYDILRLYRRGMRDVEETYKSWKTGWREKTRTVRLWERLVVILRLKPDALEETTTARTRSMEPGKIYLKSFKNIPINDVEMVLPNTQLKLRRLDRAMIGGPLIAGIGWTIFQSVGIFIALATGAFALSLDDPRLKAVGGVLLVIGGYLWKTHGKVKNTRLHYMQTLSQGLYFRNLANNRSVLHQMLAFARDADEKEAILAYHLLNGVGAMTREELDGACETWVKTASGRDADFHVGGALELLESWGLIEQKKKDRYKAVGVGKAHKLLAKRWVKVLEES